MKNGILNPPPLFLILFLVVSAVNVSPASPVLTLRDAVQSMLEHEPELNAAEYDTLSAIADHRLARSELLPQISVDSSMGYSVRDRTTDGRFRSGESLIQREIGISLRQLLYDGGLSRNNERSARNAHIAQQLTEKSLIEERVVDLSEVYLEVLRVRKQIALAQRNVDNHRAMRDMLQERAKAGGNRADVGLVQGRLQLALNTLSTQRLALNLAEARFERLVGKPPKNLTHPKVPIIASSLNALDVSRNFDVLAATEALEAAEHRYEAAKARKKPRVYFDAGVSRGDNTGGIRGEDNEVSALVVGSWDIFTGGRNKAYECREHFQVGKFEELLRAAKSQSRYNIRLLWQEREGSSSSIIALEQYAKELALVNSDYEEQFRIGHQELLNILDIQQEYYSANSRLLDAKFDKEESTYRIMGVQGTLTAYLLGSSNMDKYCKTPCETNCHPDNRVPVTQNCLMTGKFDGNGPIIDICPSTREAYYEERSQLPVKCDEDGDCGSCEAAQSIGFEKCDDDDCRNRPLKKFFSNFSKKR